MSKYLLLLGCSFLAAAPAWAQDIPDSSTIDQEQIILTPIVRDNIITVVANGARERLSQTGQSVSIFDAAEIAAVQGADITRVLQRAPGVTMSRNGGVGNFTGVRIRGAEAEQLLVVLDGVKLADPSSPGGGFDFGNLLSGGIGKIELLRGSNSVIWGSQAIGGVLSVTTAAPQGVEASAEYGSRDTLDLHAAAGLSGDGGEFFIGGGYLHTDGFSSAAVGSEPDGFRQWNVGGRGRIGLSDAFSLRASARYTDGRLDIDGFPAPDFTFADTAEFQETREYTGSAGADYDDGSLLLQANFSLSNIARDSFDPAFGSDPSFGYTGRSERVDLRGKARVTGDFAVRFGGEYEWSRFSSTFDAEQRADIGGAYAQIGYDSGTLAINAGARVDDHSRFGSAVTFGADANYNLGSYWNLRASFGEGFKAPTLFQLFSDFGNQTLAPERSTGFDLGISMSDRNLPEHFAITLFRRDSENLIDFTSCFGVTGGICTDRPYGTYDNVGRTRAQGIEVEAGYAWSETLSSRAAYAFVEAENRTIGSANRGRELARRPGIAATLSTDWTPGAFRLGADLRLVSGSFDNAANSVRLDGHEVLDLRASWQVGEIFELFGRVENVTDTDYQTAAGYGTAGRGVFVGVRARR